MTYLSIKKNVGMGVSYIFLLTMVMIAIGALTKTSTAHSVSLSFVIWMAVYLYSPFTGNHQSGKRRRFCFDAQIITLCALASMAGSYACLLVSDNDPQQALVILYVTVCVLITHWLLQLLSKIPALQFMGRKLAAFFSHKWTKRIIIGAIAVTGPALTAISYL